MPLIGKAWKGLAAMLYGALPACWHAQHVGPSHLTNDLLHVIV